MPRKKTQRTCFNCGAVTETSIQTKAHRNRVYICMNGRCWSIYYDTLAKGD